MDDPNSEGNPLKRTPYCHKVRYGVTDAPIIDGDQMIGSYAPGVGIAPVLIELVYSSPLPDRPSSVSATINGVCTRFGEPERPERTMNAHFNDGPAGWPAWLAEEARLHDPNEVVDDDTPEGRRAESHDFQATSEACTCTDAGGAIAPTGHYVDCPQTAVILRHHTVNEHG